MSDEDLNFINGDGPGIMRVSEAENLGINQSILEFWDNAAKGRSEALGKYATNLHEMRRRQKMLDGFISPALGKLFETEGQFGMPGPCMIFPEEDPELR
jgi:hypothetical protein